MTNYKKISLYFAMLVLFQLTNCVDSKGSAELDKLYPQESTEFVKYEVITDEISVPVKTQPRDREVISDETFTNYFSLGLERKRVSSEIKDYKRIITTETWTRIKAEPLTWIQIGVGVTAAAALGLGGIYYLQEMRLKRRDAWRLKPNVQVVFRMFGLESNVPLSEVTKVRDSQLKKLDDAMPYNLNTDQAREVLAKINIARDELLEQYKFLEKAFNEAKA